MKILINIILFIVATSLVLFCLPFLIIFSIFVEKDFGGYLYRINTSLSQLGNVLGSNTWNAILVKGNFVKYGNPDETISGVTGKNLRKGTLSKAGHVLNWILDKLEKDHSIKSIEDNE